MATIATEILRFAQNDRPEQTTATANAAKEILRCAQNDGREGLMVVIWVTVVAGFSSSCQLPAVSFQLFVAF
ncbi:hypothetical protein [Granulicella tundricola]|uniref:hypothetical protein n=1 Tax=Granulicella tundricola TaxID=940615 RepID=UPI000318D8B4|nr:hypothetical protein [Granulicella tundricola]